jgi:hypothetical protein
VLTLRRIWVVLVGGWIASWLTGALLGWVLGLDDTLVAVLSAVAFVLGALASVGEARSVEPWTAWDERDAYLGWFTFFGVVAVIVCLLLPIPWGFRGFAAAAVAGLTIVVLRRAPPPEPRPPEPQ